MQNLLKQKPEKIIGSQYIDLKALDLHEICQEAVKKSSISENDARIFFQTWFTPVEFVNEKPVEGLFTGYYMPLLHGSKKKTARFNVPIYGLPKTLLTVPLGLFDPSLNPRKLLGRVKGNKVIPYYTRKEINKGAIKKRCACTRMG